MNFVLFSFFFVVQFGGGRKKDRCRLGVFGLARTWRCDLGRIYLVVDHVDDHQGKEGEHEAAEDDEHHPRQAQVLATLVFLALGRRRLGFGRLRQRQGAVLRGTASIKRKKKRKKNHPRLDTNVREIEKEWKESISNKIATT